MSTNFYWYVEHHPVGNVTLPTGEAIYRGSGLDDDDPNYHLGKRSGAGPYCWDCRITLCKEGESKIHFSHSGFHEKCPQCGKTKEDSYPSRFDRVADEPQVPPEPGEIRKQLGVGYACSFSWAQDPDRALKIMMDKPDEILVEDEYGQKYTGLEFIRMLDADCPIHFRESIGQRFS